MYSRFIVHRPVLAGVIAIVTVLAGVVTLQTLPVALYPDVTPPTVVVTASYPGANAETVSDTVAVPIEEQVNGVEGMEYMSSTCSADGSYSLTVTFEVGTDLDMAQVLVQNRVTLATPKLPDEVKQQGVSTEKKSTNFVMLINLFSKNNEFDDLFLSNYATINIRDVLSRVPGVGDVQVLGAGDYSMRLWLDPDQLKHRNLTADDVVSTIREQNVQVAAGVIGQPPADKGLDFQYTITVPGRLKTVGEFEEMILKTGKDGQVTRVRDVARVELGAQSYSTASKLNGRPCTTIMVYQLTTANTIDVAAGCREQLLKLAEVFPTGLEYRISYDASWYINSSIHEIYTTLYQAVGLVVLIVFLFLQDWRASLIPTICIPVSLVGTFIFMGMMGFSVNTLTLFGLVLSIGVVVDDSIVVVENTQRHIDLGEPPREAAAASLKEIMSPCIATTLVLLSVFVPTAFLGGITGRMYRQFALTISASTVLSTINALTLSPALCGLLLRPTKKKKNLFFRLFDRVFGASETLYTGVVKHTVRRGILTFLLFGGVCALMALGFVKLPTGFLPTEDQGYMMVNIQLPDAASLERSEDVAAKVTKIYQNIPGVANVVSVSGYSFLSGSNASNYASGFIFFTDWSERKKPSEQLPGIVAQAVKAFAAIPEARIIPLVPPSIMGLGATGGFSLELEDRANIGLQSLQAVADDIMDQANADPELQSVYSAFRANVPQLHVTVNATKVKTMGLNLTDVYDTMQGYLGSKYVNDFNKFGRTYQVNIQADSASRMIPEDIGRLWVRNRYEQMAPLSTVVNVAPSLGPQVVFRYNMYPASLITGNPAPGKSSGEAMNRVAEIAEATMPGGMGHEWTTLSYEEAKAAGGATMIFALGAIFVYLFLAAQYESFLLPISVLMSVPFALLGAVGATWLRAYDVNLYTQIGVVLLIGVASKTSILIVEFARQRREQGDDRFQAAVTAGRTRYRPILMTAFSAVFGWMPLVIATGAGSVSRRCLGTAVLGGIVLACFIGIAFVPAYYAAVQRISDRLDRRKQAKAQPQPATPESREHELRE
ncbi:MAG: multidrug efflux RND transporter permease subunit [Phycisphaerae bacterium]|nr:multidrug efflux RND transporter permease subunit [Phycisphaerae bacterium]